MSLPSYNRSRAILARHGVQWPEALPEGAFAEYRFVREQEEREVEARRQMLAEKLRQCLARGRETINARRAARRARLLAILAERPLIRWIDVRGELGCSKTALREDRIALGLNGRARAAVCPTCGRPMSGDQPHQQ